LLIDEENTNQLVSLAQKENLQKQEQFLLYLKKGVYQSHNNGSFTQKFSYC